MKRVPAPLPLALLAAAIATVSCAARSGLFGERAAGAAHVLRPGWSVDLDEGGPLELRPAGGGFLVIGPSGRLHGIDGSSGAISWKGRLDAPPAGPATGEAASGGTSWLAVPLAESLDVIATSDGRILSRIPGQAGGSVTLSAVPGGLLVTGAPAFAALLDPLTGRELWRAALPSPASAPAAQCGEILAVGLANGDLAALDSASGAIRWTKSLGSPLMVSPGCTSRHLMAATEDNSLHALRLWRRHAGRMWRFKAGADPAAPPVMVGAEVLLLSKDTYLYGLKRRNGHLRFRVRLGRRPGPAGLLEELVLVAGSQSTRLEAYRLPLGLNAGGFDLPVGSRFVTPPVVSGGRVALGVAKFGVTDSSTVIALVASEEQAGGGEASGPAR